MLPLIVRYLSPYLLCLSILGSCATSSNNTTTLEATPPPTKSFILPQSDSFSYHLFDGKDSYDFVGAIRNYNSDSLIGTGVLIAPNVVLSAAHVVNHTDMDNLEWVEVDGKSSCIERIVYFPSVLGEKWHDIAIVFLESESDKNPCSLYDNAKDHLYKNMPVTTVGHGHGLRRTSKPDVFRYYGRLVRSPRFMIMLPLKDTVWHGDSGGAILTPDNKLIGIISHYAITSEGRIFENAAASIEFYREWIETHVVELKKPPTPSKK